MHISISSTTSKDGNGHGIKPLPIRCQCCGEVLVAKIYKNKLAIKTKRFGKWHDTYLDLNQIKILFAEAQDQGVGLDINP